MDNEKITPGIESLKASVMNDCAKGENCFNPNGCDKQATVIVPEDDPTMWKYSKTCCKSNIKCFHQYCNTYKWVLDRAKLYADLTGMTVEQVVEAWEKGRNYWYMNYYQDCKQPAPKNFNGKVYMYDDWIKELKEKFGPDSKNWKFKCPRCGNIQSEQDFIDNGVEGDKIAAYFNCIGRHVKGKGCDWTLGGLMQIHNTIVIKDLQIHPAFEIA